MMVGHIVTINKEKYKILCDLSYEEKATNEDEGLGIKVRVKVIRLSDNKSLSWKELKKSYKAEKIRDFVKNSINGQNTFYWDWDESKEKQVVSTCEDCGYSTGYVKDTEIHKVLADEGGYLISDGEGGYFSQCPKCKTESLILEC